VTGARYNPHSWHIPEPVTPMKYMIDMLKFQVLLQTGYTLKEVSEYANKGQRSARDPFPLSVTVSNPSAPIWTPCQRGTGSIYYGHWDLTGRAIRPGERMARPLSARSGSIASRSLRPKGNPGAPTLFFSNAKVTEKKRGRKLGLFMCPRRRENDQNPSAGAQKGIGRPPTDDATENCPRGRGRNRPSTLRESQMSEDIRTG